MSQAHSHNTGLGMALAKRSWGPFLSRLVMVCEVEFRDMKGSLVTLRHKQGEEDSGYRLQSAQVLVT